MLALDTNTIVQIQVKVREEVFRRVKNIYWWGAFKKNMIVALKVLPLAMNPHKLWKYGVILDLSFLLRVMG